MYMVGYQGRHILGIGLENLRQNLSPLVRERVGPLAGIGWSREEFF
jgi:hypothetical protein